jgi:hypothetical protein
MRLFPTWLHALSCALAAPLACSARGRPLRSLRCPWPRRCTGSARHPSREGLAVQSVLQRRACAASALIGARISGKGSPANLAGAERGGSSRISAGEAQRLRKDMIAEAPQHIYRRSFSPPATQKPLPSTFRPIEFTANLITFSPCFSRLCPLLTVSCSGATCFRS